jgi:hypothetical protein
MTKSKGKTTETKEALRAFLSYSTKDNALAVRLKRELRYLAGLEVFLAPKDLKPSREQWRNRIIKSVKECDPFLALLTNRYRKSDWTDQESGMAMASGKLIIPLIVGESKVYGFLESYQYQNFKVGPKSFRKSCSYILKAIKMDKRLRDKVRWSFIQSLNTSRTFQESKDRSELLEVLGPYSPEQINSLFHVYLTNKSIYHGYTAAPIVVDLLARNRKVLQSALIRRAKRLPQSLRSEHFIGIERILK